MPSDFDFDDNPRRRRSRSEAGHGSSAFLTMLGGSLGCFAAVVLVCAGIIGLAIFLRQPPP